MPHMEPTDELINSIYAEKVQARRRMPLEQKLIAGPELFAFACETSRMGIRMQNPNASDAEVEAMLRKRLEIGRWMEDRIQ